MDPSGLLKVLKPPVLDGEGFSKAFLYELFCRGLGTSPTRVGFIQTLCLRLLGFKGLSIGFIYKVGGVRV